MISVLGVAPLARDRLRLHRTAQRHARGQASKQFPSRNSARSPTQRSEEFVRPATSTGTPACSLEGLHHPRRPASPLPKTATLLQPSAFAHKDFAARVAKFSRSARTFHRLRVLQRADKRRRRACDDSAGTTSAAGTPSTNSCPAIPPQRIALRTPEQKVTGNYVDCGNKIVRFWASKISSCGYPRRHPRSRPRRAQQVGDIVRLLEEQRRHTDLRCPRRDILVPMNEEHPQVDGGRLRGDPHASASSQRGAAEDEDHRVRAVHPPG